MPRRRDIESICLIGSGPIVIGQACEFDYAGCQALKVLREDGFRTIVVNSNPATIMTDPGFADRTYLEPLDLEGVAGVLERERPDALLPTMGGQTALNLAVALAEEGILDDLGVELIGAPIDVIRRAEDRELFRETVRAAGLRVPESTIVTSVDDVPEGLSLPGHPAARVHARRPRRRHGADARGAERLLERALAESPVGQVLVEESLLGWDEFELELMRDHADNAVVVCSIENLDPMGVHTGDSVTVAPQMTLSDEAYQELRDAAIAVIRAVGVDCGGSNIQFARERETGELRVIEMNPRVSRSSALASKATGYPIAKVAAKLAVGYTLDEIPNDLTGTTPASFEPTLDYVVVKFPRFAFEKFPGADTTLGTQMKSVGEAMGIGRTFGEAFLKARRSRELDGRRRLGPARGRASVVPRRARAARGRRRAPRRPRRRRLGSAQAARPLGRGDRGRCAERPRSWRGRSGAAGASGRRTGASTRARPRSRRARTTSTRRGARRTRLGPDGSKPRVVILGSGPNRIGQGIEFDYCCVHAAQAFRALGYEAVMVNCNPETVSTDYDTSDRLYFEPLGAEEVLEICARELPDGVVIQFGGQTPLKLAREIETEGWRILGTPFDAVDLAEDRERFGALCEELEIAVPSWSMAEGAGEAVYVAEAIGYPVLVRPSYVLGGRNMQVCYDAESVAAAAEIGGRVLVDRFLEGAIEIDVDALCDGRETYVAAVMEHVEEAGVHSGDSSCVLPAPSLDDTTLARIEETVREARACARSRRPRQRPARGPGRRGLRARGEPAGVANRPVREQGDRAEPRRGRLQARRGRSPVRARPVPGSDPDTIQCQSGRASVRALPGRRPGARARDALDRRGDGERSRPPDGARQGRARRRPAAADGGDRVPLGARRRQAGARRGRRLAVEARVPPRRDRGHGESARERTDRRRARAQGDRARGGGDRRRPRPPRALRPRRQHATRRPGRALGRLSDPRGRARRPRAVHHDDGRRRAAVRAIADAQGDLAVSLQERISAQKRTA